MLVAITSDIHNNLTNLKKVLNYCVSKKIGKMICCGDLASMETLDFLNDNFSGEIFYCFGNMDDGQMNQTFSPDHCAPSNDWKEKISQRGNGTEEKYKYKNTLVFKNYGEMKIDDKQIAFVHYPDIAKKLAESGKYDFVFYGHTHKPWVSSAKASADQGQKKCVMLNPGNIANELYPPTFAIWNTENDEFELVRVNELK